MSADHGMKKASRGLARAITSQVTNDPNDKTGAYIDQPELISHYGQRVTQAQIWECPLQSLSPALQVFGMVDQEIVVTMQDGKLYLVHKLASGKNDGLGEAVVADASKMGSQWAWVKSKTVNRAKLEDYVEKCGDRYHLYSNNCLHAVKRMWELD